MQKIKKYVRIYIRTLLTAFKMVLVSYKMKRTNHV